MSKNLDFSPLLLTFKTVQHNNQKRVIPYYKDSYTPPISLSHYECYLSQKTNSYASVKTELLWLSYIYTWSCKFGYNIEKDLLSGSSPSRTKMNAFSNWLRNKGSIKTSSELSIKYVNTILTATSSMYCWFIELYGKFPGTSNEIALNRKIVIESVKEQFKKLKRKSRKIKTAPDLSEDEISKIEFLLKPENRITSLKKEKLTLAKILTRKKKDKLDFKVKKLSMSI